MIGKLKGIIEEVASNYALIDVAGVCYLVYCSRRTLQNFQLGNAAEIYIETHVREDQITLYGFGSKLEKTTFLQLITVKGVGPRMALSILGEIEVQKLSIAIISADKSVFTSISGVGPKLASRILTELKDKDFFAADESEIIVGGVNNQTSELPNINEENLQNAVQALQNLGVSRSEAYTKVSQILNTEGNISLSELIRKSLKQISK